MFRVVFKLSHKCTCVRIQSDAGLYQQGTDWLTSSVDVEQRLIQCWGRHLETSSQSMFHMLN